MLTIKFNDKAHSLPESWEEVPLAQLPALLNLIFVSPESGAGYLEILRLLLGYKPKAWKKLMKYYFSGKLDEENIDANARAIQQLLSAVSWMWNAELTINPFPEGIDILGERWLLFEEDFRSMSFGELTNAHIHAQVFIKQLVEGEERLDLLVASLCRPERSGNYEKDPAWNGDRREPFNEHSARHRATLLTGEYVKEKILVLMYFIGTLKEFFSYFDLFESDATGPAEKEEYPGQSLVKNQHLLSEKHIFGGMADTRNANVHDVFQFLEEHKKDIKAEAARFKAAEKEEG